MFYKKNLIKIGLCLLGIFAIAVWLVGIGIDRTARQMHYSMLEEVGRYRTDLIALDFRKTVELPLSIRDYLEAGPENDKELQGILRGMVRMDAKVTRIWYKKKDKKLVAIDSMGVLADDPVLATTLEKITMQAGERARSSLYYSDGILYWTTYRKLKEVIIGLDISLPGLHAYFASKSPEVRSYAYILNADGIVLAHPDETRIGRTLANPDDVAQFNEVIRKNKMLHCTGFSLYLSLPVERVYYPVTMGNEKWAVVVNIPELITKEEMHGFHRYTLIIVVFTVLLFSILLAFSQYRWKKEYDRRVKLEQETLQLNMQQLKNQINPHFLFNSLNSLSALIGTEPAVAKEFVLNLSKIYRYVLEKRNESVVPVREEIIFIRHYYFLQKIRFREQFQLEIAPDVEHEDKAIPVMSLQLLIENAIKHNEITRQYPLKMHIYLKGENIIVENTYTPRVDVSENSWGIGFENIQKIYSYCSDKYFSYKVQDGIFVCVLPLL